MCMCAVAADTMIQYGNYCKAVWAGNGIIDTGKTHRLPFFLFVSNRRYARNAPVDPRPRGRQSRTTVGLNDRTNRSDRPTGPTDRPTVKPMDRHESTRTARRVLHYCVQLDTAAASADRSSPTRRRRRRTWRYVRNAYRPHTRIHRVCVYAYRRRLHCVERKRNDSTEKKQHKYGMSK